MQNSMSETRLTQTTKLLQLATKSGLNRCSVEVITDIVHNLVPAKLDVRVNML